MGSEGRLLKGSCPCWERSPFALLFPPSGRKCCSNNHIGPQVDLVAGGCCRLIIAPKDMSVTKSLNLWMLLYLEKWPVWMWLRIVQLSHHPGLSRWVWDAITSNVTKGKAEGDQTITHREGHVKTETENGVMQLQTKDQRKPPEVRSSKEKLLPGVFRWRTALLTPWCLTSSLQNCERINFCCFYPTSLW